MPRSGNRVVVKTPKGQSVRDALPKLMRMLDRRGLDIAEQPDVPLFRADPSRDGVLIRRLNGRETAGRIDARGTFRPLRTSKRVSQNP